MRAWLLPRRRAVSATTGRPGDEVLEEFRAAADEWQAAAAELRQTIAEHDYGQERR